LNTFPGSLDERFGWPRLAKEQGLLDERIEEYLAPDRLGGLYDLAWRKSS
jgi:hypothetical protein